MPNKYLQASVDYAIEHQLFKTGVTVTVSGETSKKKLYAFMLNSHDSVMAIVGHFEEPYICCDVHFSHVRELEEVWRNG
jgi:hypothetical protein